MKTTRERGWLFNPLGLYPWPILVVGGVLAIVFGAVQGSVVSIVVGSVVSVLGVVRFGRWRKRRAG